MAQTDYSIDLAQAVAGMPADNGLFDCLTCVASEDIPPGRYVEFDSANTVAGDDRPRVRLPQGTGAAIAKPVGISMHKPGRELTSVHPAGATLSIMRRGRIYAESVAASATVFLDAVKISHSSTVATDRGKVTDAVSSATAGSEVDATAGLGKFLGDKTNGLVRVEVSFS